MSAPEPPRPASHFLRQIIERDLAEGRFAHRLWAGTPGDADHHAHAALADPARMRTRFPPEPNGYLHIGHAKSICLNFGLARDHGGVCHLRFDDTNPEQEEQEYVDAIVDAVRWLGWSWDAHGRSHLYYASDYFDVMYRCAEYLVETGHAYVDEQTPEQMRAARGDFTTPGTESPYRPRSADDNLARLREMRAGRHADGAMVLRAKIDMASPNLNLRDPAIYRIKHAAHHNTGNAWCIYPMYAYAHPIEDALENITHSICTLEFEDQRPFYDWTLERLVPVLRAPQLARALAVVERIAASGVEAGKEFALACHNQAHKLGASEPEGRLRALFLRWARDRDAVLRDLPVFFALLREHARQFTPLLEHALRSHLAEPFELPHQYEFARLNLTGVVTSKRKLRQLVDEGVVDGWDDPRLPTLAGLRRRGYTPQAIRLFAERIGVAKAESWIDHAVLEQALRDDLDGRAPRAMAVLDPVRLELTNWAEVFGRDDHVEPCGAPAHPQQPALGQRSFGLARELWIERSDYAAEPPKGFHRLHPGNAVRLKYGVVVECSGHEADADGRITKVLARVVPDTRSGTPGADRVKVRGVITWVGAHDALAATVHLYAPLFTAAQPDAGGRDFMQALAPDSRRSVQAWVEPALAAAAPEDRYQFERHGYFVADRVAHRAGAPVFNRITGLRDGWAR